MFEWIAGLIDRLGYAGIALLMFAENIFPPIPSEIVMPAAGYDAARGERSLIGVIAAGLVGSLAGALFWYGIGRWVGDERLKAWAGRHGRWLTMTPRDVVRADRWFERHCGWAVLIGRLIPAVRTLISVPAGIFGMALPRFLLFSGIGSAIWTTALALAGYQLGRNYAAVGDYLGPVSNTVIATLVVVYVVRVLRWKPANSGR
jgi:membrane protein DedA with SNARE-associated domain